MTELFQMWAIQYWSKRAGWWTVHAFVRPTRSDAIQAYRDVCSKRGDLMWRRMRRAGKVRCVRVTVEAPKGDANAH